MKQAVKEQNIDFDLKVCACDGMGKYKLALLKKNKNLLDAGFIEGMACVGGCMGGAGCLTHGEKNKAEVDKYGRGAMKKTISDALCVLPRKTECNDNKNSKAHLCGEFFFLTNLARGIIVLLSTRQKGQK